MSNASGHSEYSYDQRGRLLAQSQTVSLSNGDDLRVVSYAYGTLDSSAGRLISLTYPSGNRISYIHDKSGRISGLTLHRRDGSQQVLLSQINYTPFGSAMSWVWGEGKSRGDSYQRIFDLDGRVVSYPLGNVLSGGLMRKVSYDAAGRITAYTHTGGKGTLPPASGFDQSFSYDNAHRLIKVVTATSTQGYSYDLNGNRIQVQQGVKDYVYTVSPKSNMLSATTGPQGVKSYQHDAVGSIVNDGLLVYSYREDGRLSSISKNGLVSASYMYNAHGQRVSKQSSVAVGGANTYVYDSTGHLLGEYVAKGGVLQETVYLGDQPVAVLISSGGGTAAFYVYADHANTPRVITSSVDHKIVWRWDGADPFGVGVPIESPSGGAAFIYNLRFPGQVYDRETNTHYNYFRDYDPTTGRYIESDPIGLRGGNNTYTYVLGNPLTLTDPDGLCPFCLAIPAVCAGGACEAGLALLGGAGWFAATRPQDMTRLEERHFDRQCKNTDDPCRNLKAAVATAISDARIKMNAMRSDTLLYKYAYNVPNPSVTTTNTTWMGHADDLNGRINNVWAMITLGRKLGCDMSSETSAAMTLLTPSAPNP